jgi:hypothetical protein
MYNTTDFGRFAMSTVARSRFGSKGEIIRYACPFDRSPPCA